MASKMDFQCLINSFKTLHKKDHGMVCKDTSSKMPTKWSKVNFHKKNSTRAGKAVTKTEMVFSTVMSSEGAISSTDTVEQ